MRCPIENHGNADLLLDYSARKLNPELAAILEAHMDVCPACREFRDGQRAVWAALDQWEAAPVSADFDRRLFQRIESEHRPSLWSRLFEPLQPFFWRPAVPLGATACLLVAVGFVLQKPNVSPVLPDETRKVQEVEQVERTLEDLDMLRQFNLAAPESDS